MIGPTNHGLRNVFGKNGFVNIGCDGRLGFEISIEFSLQIEAFPAAIRKPHRITEWLGLKRKKYGECAAPRLRLRVRA